MKPIEMDNKHGKSCEFIGLFIDLKPPTANDVEYEGRSINCMECVTDVSFTEKEISFSSDSLSFFSDVKEMVLDTSIQSRKFSLNAVSIRVECEGTGDCSLVGIDSCFYSQLCKYPFI